MGAVPPGRFRLVSALRPRDHFPLFCDVRGKRALVVGGGAIAARRCATLCRFSFSVEVVAPQVCPSLEALAQQGLLTIARRPFAPPDVTGAFLVVAATDRREVNRQVGQLSRRQGAFVSVADCAQECTFFFPALVEQGDLTIGVTGNGKDHKAVARCAQKIREMLKE